MNAGSMSTQRRRRASEPIGLIITLLALVALIGLLSGILTRTLSSRQAHLGLTVPTATTTAPATAASSPTPPPTAPASVTATTATIAGHFELSVTVTPKTVSAGQQITITVAAFTPDTHTPVAGLPCILRAPVDGSPALFTTWPPAQTTDANGAASWILTAPTRPAGTYEVEAFAKTHSWAWKADSTVSLLAS